MKNKFVNLGEYIKVLFSDVIFLLSGFLGVLAWILSLVLEQWEVRISYIIILFALIIAPYRAWSKLNSKLNTILENKVDYNFEYGIYNVILTKDKEQLLNLFNEGKEEFDLTQEEEYKQKLQDYLVGFAEYIKLIDNLYKINLDIRNIGYSYDEKINITIKPKNNAKFLYHINHKPIKPRRPSIFDTLDNLVDYPRAPLIENISNSYREVLIDDEKVLKVNLRELSVQDLAAVLYGGFYIYSSDSLIELDVIISSKKTHIPINKTISIDSAYCKKITLEELEEDN